MLVMWYNAPGIANLWLLGALFASGAIVGAGFLLLKAPSREGRKTMDQIEGFREYLGVAEEDRLNALNPPEKTPELFERFLPYAVALDCQNAWAAKFAGVLAAAGTAAAAASWYVGSRDWASDPVSFADHLGSDLSQTIASSSTPPGSSDSGGGGGRQQRRRFLRRRRRRRRRWRLVRVSPAISRMRYSGSCLRIPANDKN